MLASDDPLLRNRCQRAGRPAGPPTGRAEPERNRRIRLVSSPFAAGGLVLDLTGAIILAIALALKRPAQRQAQTEQALKYNAAVDLDLARQRVAAIVGVLLLVLGFACQLVASLGVQPSAQAWIAPIAAAYLSLVTLGFLGLVLWPWAEHRAISQRLALFEPDEWAGFSVEMPHHVPEYQGVLAAYAFALGTRPRRGETPYDLASRILGYTRWCRLIQNKQLSDRWHEPRY
jgi:hypothetical protein